MVRAEENDMGIYNFEKRFVPFIIAGTKTHTIRAHRRYPDEAGKMLHLYTGLRHPGAMLLMRVPCVRMETIDFVLNLPKHALENSRAVSVFIDGEPLDEDEKQSLARRDGFEDFGKMMEFWNSRLPFNGQIIHWKCPEIVRRGPRQLTCNKPALRKRLPKSEKRTAKTKDL